jgi:hypothetical protein
VVADLAGVDSGEAAFAVVGGGRVHRNSDAKRDES